MTNKARPAHIPMDQFARADGDLLVHGIPLPRLTARAGDTPYYAYDRSLIDARIAMLRSVMPAGLAIHYAVKANPLPALVDHMSRLVDGFDIASAGEMETALNSGMPPANISFAGPGKRDDELRRAAAAGIRINVESIAELERLARIQQDTGWPARVALRVNPDFELKGAGMRMGGGAKPFGIDVEELPLALRRIVELGLCWEGLHIFAGSQNLKAEAIVAAQQASWHLVRDRLPLLPPGTRSINLGGGFGIPYFPGETRLDLAPIASNLAQLQTEISACLPGAQVEIELGRYLVGEAGIYVCRVIERKHSRGRIFLVTDGGMHHHLPASGNFGQILRKNYPLGPGHLATGAAQCPLETVTVTGPLCTPLDVLGDQIELPHAEPGDLVVVFQSGAYGATASPQAFLGHPAVRELLV